MLPVKYFQVDVCTTKINWMLALGQITTNKIVRLSQCLIFNNYKVNLKFCKFVIHIFICNKLENEICMFESTVKV